MHRALLLLVSVAATAAAGPAEVPPAGPDNPKPASGDLVLPMPQGAAMVFRPIPVPGKSFWGGEERIIQIGDPDGGMFEGLQRIQISGSFPGSGGDEWVYYLGKYEVTKGQYAAVMGMDALVAQSGNPGDRELAALSGERRQAALSEPVAGLGWLAVQAFIHAYNQWLFDPDHPERPKDLPHLRGVPGYLRLPTEVEWEYAARGGDAARRAGTFDNATPVSTTALNNYAWHRDNAKSRVRPIGLRDPNVLGLYDLLGNVQELASQPFLPEVWQGKPGGLVARGGSVRTAPADLRSSTRAEVGIYRWDPDQQRMEEQKSLTTGMRLAIGSDVIVSPDSWETLKHDYDTYKASLRGATPVGRTLEHPVAQGASAVGLAHAGIDELITKNEALTTELTRIKGYIEQAEQKMDQAQHEAARSLAQDALRNAANTAFSIYGASLLETRVGETNEAVKQLGRRSPDQLRLLKDQVALLTNKAAEARQNESAQIAAYAKRVAELGEYGQAYVDGALDRLGKRGDLAERERTALVLLAQHVARYRADRRLSIEELRNDFERQYGTATP